MAKQDFGNGLQYDPDTGEIVINDDTGNQVYQFDPKTNKTNYNGQSYAGRYNPAVMGLMTGDQLQSAYDPLIAGQNKYLNEPADTKKGSAGNYWQNLSQGSADSIAFNKAYFDAQKTASPDDQSFFDTLKSMSSQRQEQDHQSQLAAGQQRLQGPDQLSYKDWYGSGGAQNGNTYDQYQKQFGQPAAQPQQSNQLAQTMAGGSQQPQQSQQPDTSASQPTAQPDYSGFMKAVYGQLQPYLAQLSTPQQSVIPTSTSRPFSLSPQTSSPDFNSGGYNPQSPNNAPTTGTSGKGSPTSQPQSDGMATGQFGSK